MSWIILILGIVSNASASALIKMAVEPSRKMPSLIEPWSVFSNWPLCVGVGLYGIAFVLYAVALKQLPLNVAHPILTRGSIATVALISVFFFGEQFTMANMVGIAFIFLD